MKNFKALSKQLLGAHYEQIRNSVFACAILYFALYTAKIRMDIAPFILYFTASVFSAGVMWQALCSSKNAESMMGLFMLPFDNKRLAFTYTLAFSTHAIITKALLILVLFFAVGTWNIPQIIISLLCACNACFVAAVLYTMTGQKRTLLTALWAALIIMAILITRQSTVIVFVVLVSLGVAILYLSSVNAYLFYRPVSAKTAFRHFHNKGSVFVYLLRYLLENKNYLINTIGLWGIACFLPFLLGQFERLNTMPLGFAIICLNTPICILLSCDPALERAIRALPGQAARFCSRYCLFIFLVHMSASSIYLSSWQLQYGGIDWVDLVTAVLFAFQSAILSVVLEWRYPLRKWKVESDLWHHPRKYIVPLLMILLAALISIWELAIWVWLCVLLIECCALLFKTRRV